MKLIILLTLLLFISCSDNTNKTTNASNINSNIEKYIQAHIANNKFNGTILITKADSVVFSNSYGYANREFQIPNTDTTKFLIGSITKPFTAAAILKLEQEYELSLDDKLSKYFPDFPKSDLITVKHLLTHTSGITNYHYFSDWKADSKRDLTPYYTIERVLEHPFIFEPGEKFSYTNTGYILLGLIIEKVSNKTFAEYVNNSIIKKLGLENTGIIDNHSIIKNLASGYNSTFTETNKADYINYYQPFSSGNIYSTVEDLRKFTLAIMNNKMFDSEKTKEIFENNTGKYGYGWGIRDFDGIYGVGHYGGMNGYIGAMTYLPESQYFITFLTNDDNTPKEQIISDLVKILFDKEYENPKHVNIISLKENSISKVLGDYIVKEGDTLHIFKEKNKIYMQETAQAKHELYPISDNEFALQLFDFNVKFIDYKNDYFNSLIFAGKNLKAKRADLEK